MVMKHIDVFISDLFIKINIPKIKFVIVWDLKHQVDFANLKNRTTLANGFMDIKLAKADVGEVWEELEYSGPKSERFSRRELSIKRFEEWDKKKAELQGETNIKLDKAALDKQMQVEEYERRFISDRKEAEKKAAEDLLYQDLEEIENLNEKLKKGYDPKLIQEEANKIAFKDIHKHENEVSEESKVEEVEPEIKETLSSTKGRFSKYNDHCKDIFDDADWIILKKEPAQSDKKSKPKGDSDDDEPQETKDHSAHIKDLTGEIPEDERILNEFQSEPVRSTYFDSVQSEGKVEEIVEVVEEIEDSKVENNDLPKIREGGSKKVEFTEKLFKNMPARESHKKEPPFPKSKKLDKKKDDIHIDIEDRDPVWLKDKGDHFYKRHDFSSAMNAYSKSIKNDPEFLKWYLNRATTLLKIRNFEGAIEDLNDIETKIKAQTEEELKDPFYDKMMSRVIVKRAAAHSWLSHFDDAEKDFTRALKEYKNTYSEEEIKFIENDLNKMVKRKESNVIKRVGDALYAQGKFDEALTEYEEVLKIDPTNEYAWGNIGLINLKKIDYEKCIQNTDQALALINNFISDTKSFSNDNTLEVKLLLRRGKSYEMTQQYEKAKNDLDECVRLDRRNKQAETMLKKVQGEINDILYKENKDEAERLFKAQKYNEALEYFERWLKITRKASTLNNISVFVNKTAWLFALNQLDLMITESNNALRLIKNFLVKDITKEEKEKARNMEVLLLLRKGKALAKQSQVSKAIEQYELALDIDPENENIKNDLSKLKQSL